MSEIKVNKLTPRTNCGTTTLGDSGDTFNIPAGVTISNNGTATGFGATGAVNWDVSSIKTVDFTATSGVGYFVDTATTGAVEVTLPAAPAVGDVVGVADYANNFETANCTLNRNGLKINGFNDNATMEVDGVAVTLVYVDAAKGWIVTDSGSQSDVGQAKYIAATGGCVTTCGSYKTHTFLSPGTFTVTQVGGGGAPTTVDYLVVAGGGAGGISNGGGGGGGAGGLLYSKTCYANPTPAGGAAAPAGITVTATPYPIQAGGGGAGVSAPPDYLQGGDGTPSFFATITATGGGGGGGGVCGGTGPGRNGGSGGGGGKNGSPVPGGSGNTPSTSPSQGNDGGIGGGPGPLNNTGGGGGGHAAVGGNAQPTPTGGTGGAGSVINIRVACSAYAGGGGGQAEGQPTPAQGQGGVGGGGSAGATGTNGNAGSANTGGGGGGVDSAPAGYNSGNGGTGIVVIRYKYQA